MSGRSLSGFAVISRAQRCLSAPITYFEGDVVYQLKKSYRDGSTEVVFDPLDFTAPAHPCARGISAPIHVIARLAALATTLRVNLTCFHGL